MAMERKIGETFEYHVKMLKVKLAVGCNGCYFIGRCIEHNYCITGECNPLKRQDNKKVIFVEVKDEQPQEQAEQPKLNLCEILKNCPEGTELWSDNYGIVNFVNVGTEWDTPIRVKLTNGCIARYTEEGWCDKRFPANCLLWPSKDCRDWSKFTAPWYKKERFNPKTLKVFDRVLVRFDCGAWSATLFSHLTDSKFANKKYDIICCGSVFGYCIPYNDDTKHLVGTTDEAPDFYKYWED